MINNMTEQFRSSLSPISEMFANNAKVLTHLVEQQNKLFTDVLNEGVAFTQILSAQKDIPGVLDAQKTFVGNVQEKMTLASKDVSKLLSDAQSTAGDKVKPFFNKEFAAIASQAASQTAS